MRHPPEFADVRAVMTLALVAASACSDYDTVQPSRAVLQTLSVTLDKPVIEVGSTTLATAAGLDQYGNSIQTGTVAWSSSATSVATVNPTTGEILGIGAGTARISGVTERDLSANQVITVVNTQSINASRGTNPDTLVGTELARLRALTAQFQDLALADRAGYSLPLTGCVSDPMLGGMGFHFGKESAIDGTANPLEPEVLLYEPEANGRLRLVAVEFIVPYTFQPRNGPPPQLFGRDFTPFDGNGVWGLHAWIWRENPAGMFANFNPGVSCDAAPAASRTSHQHH